MNDLIATVVKLELLNNGKAISRGTGFFYAIPIESFYNSTTKICLPCIITTKHFLDNPDFTGYKITIQSVNRDNTYSSISVEYNLNDIEYVVHEHVDLALLCLKNVDLKKDFGYLRPNSLRYMTEDKIIMHPFLSSENLLFDNNTMRTPKISSFKNDYADVIGFHYGDDKYSIEEPINVMGNFVMTAFRNIFVIQAPLSKGSSGSPIFTYTVDGTPLLVGIIIENCSINDNIIHGLNYAVSSQNIFFLEQSIVSKLGNNELKRRKGMGGRFGYSGNLIQKYI
mgnify:CR=1 FL=1